eukprot:CAMPEP_0180700756 /NCGR_PEP_ID=MMETSP1038_2-20121128/5244_1 /TAXON_ID=632150 /ORGANISM="Azadinium spinosum, Strain 3D9" /LENGTH=379 /DNA_ID=CAMNT_0022732447 /DNA_START=66 /DNA_END=1205 /DNA_ORIENTATION=+
MRAAADTAKQAQEPVGPALEGLGHAAKGMQDQAKVAAKVSAVQDQATQRVKQALPSANTSPQARPEQNESRTDAQQPWHHNVFTAAIKQAQASATMSPQERAQQQESRTDAERLSPATRQSLAEKFFKQRQEDAKKIPPWAKPPQHGSRTDAEKLSHLQLVGPQLFMKAKSLQHESADSQGEAAADTAGDTDSESDRPSPGKEGSQLRCFFDPSQPPARTTGPRHQPRSLAPSEPQGNGVTLVSEDEVQTKWSSWSAVFAHLLQVQTPRPQRWLEAMNVLGDMSMVHRTLFAANEPLWIVVGGFACGGLLVRRGCSLTSRRIPYKLCHAAIIQELELRDGRLHYQRIRGDGPDFGWISTHKEDGSPHVLSFFYPEMDAQ